MAATCTICCEAYNASSRLCIECEYCKYAACKECCKTYILSELRPHCMNRECGREWTRQFMQTVFTKTFMAKEYKNHHKNILLDQQKSLLPATQPLVEQAIQYDRLDEERKECERIVADMQRRMTDIHIQQRAIRGTNTDITKVRSVFVRACPDENCRGFLSSQWKCGLCEKWTCSKCHEIKGTERDCAHECNPDNVETAKLLSKDTKPCPTCQMGIFKIDGCSQVWCTQCHTAFDFNTGRIETKIHNPHYYEWLRQKSANGEIPREAGDDPAAAAAAAGGGPAVCAPQVLGDHTVGRIEHAFGKHVNRDRYYKVKPDSEEYMLYVAIKAHAKYFIDLCRDMVHMTEVVMPVYRVDQEQQNQKKRIEYMRNQIDEVEFKTALEQIDKKCAKNREILDVLQMVVTAITDIVYRVIREVDTQVYSKIYIQNIKQEIENLREYANGCFVDIGKVYACKAPVLNAKFGIDGRKKRQPVPFENRPLRNFL